MNIDELIAEIEEMMSDGWDIEDEEEEGDDDDGPADPHKRIIEEEYDQGRSSSFRGD